VVAVLLLEPQEMEQQILVVEVVERNLLLLLDLVDQGLL
tara:strand:+ start:169 stop:285 length:117 start_codon:yes stop_codon:yes gene_type:complete